MKKILIFLVTFFLCLCMMSCYCEKVNVETESGVPNINIIASKH